MTAKIGDITLATTAAADDLIEMERAADGLSRRISKVNFMGGTFTGGGGLATGGFTLTVPATGTAALLGTANVFTANQRVNALVGVNQAPATGAAQLAVTSSAASVVAGRFTAAATPTVPVVSIRNNAGTVVTAFNHQGDSFHFGNPAIMAIGASNTAANVVGAPRLMFVNMELDYDGSNNTMESGIFTWTGGNLAASEARSIIVMAATVAMAGVGASEARRSLYTPVIIPTGGGYQAITASSSVVTNTGYTYTLEISGTSGGNMQVRVIRTGGSTVAGKVHVSMIIST